MFKVKKKFFIIYIFCLILIISIIIFGSLLKNHYQGHKRLEPLQKILAFLADVPANIKFILKNKQINSDVISPVYNNDKITTKEKLIFHKIPEPNFYNELILVSRHDGDLGRSIVEIRDANTFEVLHSYIPDINEIYKKINLNKKEFKNLKKHLGVNRFFMWNPDITETGSLIFHSSSPLIKIDFNSKIIWVNDRDIFHHSINTDNDGNIYVPSHLNPLSSKVSEIIKLDENNKELRFLDDAITILNKKGEIIFSKSIIEIFIENDLTNKIFSQATFAYNPIHLNDIEPVLEDTKYFKKGDLFLSLRNLSMVLLYRPSNNKIINIIDKKIMNQHDVDIVDDKTISIFNNNVLLLNNSNRISKNNEIILYDFEKNSYSKRFEKLMINKNVNNTGHGVIEYLSNGSAIIEDRNYGRIMLIDKNNELVWEFYNLDSNNDAYDLWWSRVINEDKSKKIRDLING